MPWTEFKHTQGIWCNAECAFQRVGDQDRGVDLEDRDDGREEDQSQVKIIPVAADCIWVSAISHRNDEANVQKGGA